MELKCLINGKEDQMALRNGPAISAKERSKAEGAKSKGLAISYQRILT